MYIHDLSPTISNLSKPIIFTGDTSVIISCKNFEDFHTSNIILSQMSTWFSAKKLALYLDKTNIKKFITKNSPLHNLSIGYKEKYMEETVNTKFLCLPIDKHLNWKNNIDQICSEVKWCMLCS
jgi:hypothetical protein